MSSRYTMTTIESAGGSGFVNRSSAAPAHPRSPSPRRTNPDRRIGFSPILRLVRCREPAPTGLRAGHRTLLRSRTRGIRKNSAAPFETRARTSDVPNPETRVHLGALVGWGGRNRGARPSSRGTTDAESSSPPRYDLEARRRPVRLPASLRVGSGSTGPAGSNRERTFELARGRAPTDDSPTRTAPARVGSRPRQLCTSSERGRFSLEHRGVLPTPRGRAPGRPSLRPVSASMNRSRNRGATVRPRPIFWPSVECTRLEIAPPTRVATPSRCWTRVGGPDQRTVATAPHPRRGADARRGRPRAAATASSECPAPSVEGISGGPVGAAVARRQPV